MNETPTYAELVNNQCYVTANTQKYQGLVYFSVSGTRYNGETLLEKEPTVQTELKVDYSVADGVPAPPPDPDIYAELLAKLGKTFQDIGTVTVDTLAEGEPATVTIVKDTEDETLANFTFGIPTGATYAGYRFFYPGSASLAAGWYDSIVAIPDANTLTFTAPGADFGSQSINAAAAYTTATNLPSGLTIPANTLVEDVSLRLSAPVASSNTAATKTIRPFLGVSSLAPASSGTTFNCGVKEWVLTPTDSGLLVGSPVRGDNTGSGGIASLAVNFNTELTVLIQVTVSAAADFIAVVSSPKLVIF